MSDPARWVDEHGDRLFRYALSRVRDPRACEELLQQTFVAALESRARYKGESSELTWLTGILRNKIFEHFRRQSREIPLGAEPGEDGDDFFDGRGHWRSDAVPSIDWDATPARLAESAEFAGALSRCLDALTPAGSRAFVLKEMEGLDNAAAAEALGVPAAHLAVLLYRARLRLRRCLERGYFAKGPA